MFLLNDDLSIYATRGDIVFFNVTAQDNGQPYTFQSGDLIRFKIYGKKNAENVILQKDFPVLNASESVEILLTKEDTKIGEIISKPVDYWYEIELNPLTNPQTIIGYDDYGAKIFRVLPEGEDYAVIEPDPEDVAVLDSELDLKSTRPVENQAISRAIIDLQEKIDNILTGDLIVTGTDGVMRKIVFNSNGSCSWVKVE